MSRSLQTNVFFSSYIWNHYPMLKTIIYIAFEVLLYPTTYKLYINSLFASISGSGDMLKRKIWVEDIRVEWLHSIEGYCRKKNFHL